MLSTTRRRDIAVGIVGMAVSALLGIEAFGMSYPSKAFPLLVCGTMFVVTTLIALRALVRPDLHHSVDTAFLPSARSLFVVATAICYVWLITVLGFYVSSFICIIIVSAITEYERFSLKTAAFTALAALIFLALIYLLFSYIFKSTVPQGLFF